AIGPGRAFLLEIRAGLAQSATIHGPAWPGPNFSLARTGWAVHIYNTSPDRQFLPRCLW
ncbi:hypothetical protein TorRG33x02_136830, partial [Trema orientale]